MPPSGLRNRGERPPRAYALGYRMPPFGLGKIGLYETCKRSHSNGPAGHPNLCLRAGSRAAELAGQGGSSGSGFLPRAARPAPRRGRCASPEQVGCLRSQQASVFSLPSCLLAFLPSCLLAFFSPVGTAEGSPGIYPWARRLHSQQAPSQRSQAHRSRPPPGRHRREGPNPWKPRHTKTDGSRPPSGPKTPNKDDDGTRACRPESGDPARAWRSGALLCEVGLT